MHNYAIRYARTQSYIPVRAELRIEPSKTEMFSALKKPARVETDQERKQKETQRRNERKKNVLLLH